VAQFLWAEWTSGHPTNSVKALKEAWSTDVNHENPPPYSPGKGHCYHYAAVCLPLLIFPCIIKSRSSLLAPAHPCGPRKRAIKRLWCGIVLDFAIGGSYMSICTSCEFFWNTDGILHVMPVLMPPEPHHHIMVTLSCTETSLRLQWYQFKN